MRWYRYQPATIEQTLAYVQLDDAMVDRICLARMRWGATWTFEATTEAEMLIACHLLQRDKLVTDLDLRRWLDYWERLRP